MFRAAQILYVVAGILASLALYSHEQGMLSLGSHLLYGAALLFVLATGLGTLATIRIQSLFRLGAEE